MIIKEKLYDSIFKCIQNENNDLRNNYNQGIFFAPEIYLAFKIGKGLIADKVFGSDIEWLRETKIGTIGITDIVFKSSHTTYLFELKKQQRDYNYLNDVEKLRNQEGPYEKYFIALADSYTDKVDQRIDKVSCHESTDPIVPKFNIIYDINQSGVCCTVGVWQIIC